MTGIYKLTKISFTQYSDGWHILTKTFTSRFLYCAKLLSKNYQTNPLSFKAILYICSRTG